MKQVFSEFHTFEKEEENIRKELLQRNYTLLGKTEKTVIADRKRVVAKVGRFAKKSFKAFGDETAFFEWLKECASQVEEGAPAAPVL
ncbi:unnamed protein product [Caenorhabditis sp. 36 PRJEB53466]|nr:unnamed protein product [Caenorhabditis sp. 36 PRJEB53466]